MAGCGPSQPAVYNIIIVFHGADGAGALQFLPTSQGSRPIVGLNSDCQILHSESFCLASLCQMLCCT
jgi:hypothetical protein